MCAHSYPHTFTYKHSLCVCVRTNEKRNVPFISATDDEAVEPRPGGLAPTDPRVHSRDSPRPPSLAFCPGLLSSAPQPFALL